MGRVLSLPIVLKNLFTRKGENAVSLNTANDIISFLQSTKYRVIDVKTINKILQENRDNSLFKEFIRGIFLESYPKYPALSVKEMIQSKDDDNPIHWMSVDFNLNLADDHFATKRFFDFMKVTDGNYRSVFYNTSISCEEAYFYLDLLRGCKFGLSYSQLSEFLFNGDFLSCKTHFKEPIYVEDKFIAKSFPVICQPSLKGFHFIAKIFNGNYQVTCSNGKILTAKFGILRKISQFVPTDKKLMLDFVLQPRDMSPKGFSTLEKQLTTDEAIKKAKLIILDFYCKDDKALLLKRLHRIEKLVEKCYSINMSSIECIPYKVISTQEKLDAFINKLLGKKQAVFIKNNGFYKEKPYKAITQFNLESMMVEDYSTKQTTKLNKRQVMIDCITCRNNLGETVLVKNWSNSIEQSIFNLVGCHVKIRWEDDLNGEHYPYIFAIDRYRKIENIR